uniref:Amine oxidase domain-containing protein n=1 Tax=Octactis speculum TaxID=3111310 RepID=A0A7S2GZM8_9STRA
MSKMGGRSAVQEWEGLRDFIDPLERAILALPPLALRADLSVASTALPYLPGLADPRIGLKAGLLSGPWEAVLDKARVSNQFLRRWFDFLAFAFSGLPSDGTVAAAMVYMMAEFYKEGAKMDYPIGGSGAVVDALVRGVEKRGGQVRLRSPVSEIILEDGRAVGVTLKSGEKITAKHAVISNAPVWGTAKLLPPELRSQFKNDKSALDETTPMTPSFMHLHLGITAEGLSDEALSSIHHIVVPSWEHLTAPQQTVFVSIPSILDPTLAPPGHHVIHAYLPATEPFEIWEGLDTQSEEYKKLKQDRVKCLFSAIERFIPDIRERIVVEMAGSPLTHQRFLNRPRGTYGPELSAGEGEAFPGARTPIDGLLCCGDSTWPGIGVPAVAGSGIAAANAVRGTAAPQRELLQEMRTNDLLRPRLS